MMITRIKIYFFALAVLFTACELDEDDPLSIPAELSGTVDQPLVLENLADGPGADYFITGKWTLNAAVRIEPGVNIMMKSGSSVYINEEGSLNAIGTDTNPITFFGEQSAKGHWEDITFDSSDQTDNKMEFVFISDGGDGFGNGMVTLRGNTRLSMSNCILSNSRVYGLYVVNDNATLPDFMHNTVTDCNDYPIGIKASQLHFMDATTDFTNNGSNGFIEVDRGELHENVLWKKLAGPVLFVSSYNNIHAAVTVEPGAVFVMGPESQIIVEPEGSLQMIGTPDEHITITGKAESPGYFQDIILDDSNNPRNEWQYVDISYGGDSYHDANVAVTGSSLLKIGNCSFNYSAQYGMYVSRNSELTDMGGNTFTGNAGDDIYFQD